MGSITQTNLTSGTTKTNICFTSLPVSLLSFSGILENNSVKLSWSTASEENNNYFSLERSIDGQSFSVIGKVNGAGNSSMLRNYEFIDETPEVQNYYRLSQTDFNGQSNSLGIISVKLSNEGSGLALTVQSNPVKTDKVFLDLFSPRTEEIIINVTDLQGRILLQEKHPMQESESKFISIDLSSISMGTYFISATSRNSSVTRKILLLRGE